MIYREATINDISQIQVVRNIVKENMLSNPALVPDSDVLDYITRRGKGWICEAENKIVGFAIATLLTIIYGHCLLTPNLKQKV